MTEHRHNPIAFINERFATLDLNTVIRDFPRAIYAYQLGSLYAGRTADVEAPRALLHCSGLMLTRHEVQLQVWTRHRIEPEGFTNKVASEHALVEFIKTPVMENAELASEIGGREPHNRFVGKLLHCYLGFIAEADFQEELRNVVGNALMSLIEYIIADGTSFRPYGDDNTVARWYRDVLSASCYKAAFYDNDLRSVVAEFMDTLEEECDVYGMLHSKKRTGHHPTPKA